MVKSIYGSILFEKHYHMISELKEVGVVVLYLIHMKINLILFLITPFYVIVEDMSELCWTMYCTYSC